jgi:hypothetical protein
MAILPAALSTSIFGIINGLTLRSPLAWVTAKFSL